MRVRSASVGKVLGGFVGLFGVAAGCTSFGSDSTPPVVSSEAGTPDVSVLPGETINIESLAITDKTVTVAQGRETTLTVKIVRGPFRDQVAISLKNLTKDFTSAPVVIPAGKDTVDIKLAAAATAPLGAGQNVRVLAESGVASKDIEAPLLVVGAPGSLDLSYGDQGVYRGPEADVEQVYDAALLPDDSVIVAGRDMRGMFLRKITKDGKPDTSYGVGGKFQPTFSIGSGTAYYHEPFAVAPLSNGRVLLAYRQYASRDLGNGASLGIVAADGKGLAGVVLPTSEFAQVASLSPLGMGRIGIVGEHRSADADLEAGRGTGFIAAAFDTATSQIDSAWGAATQHQVTGWAPAPGGVIQGSWTTVGVAVGVGYFMVPTGTGAWLLGDSGQRFGEGPDKVMGVAKLSPAGKFLADYGDKGLNWWEWDAVLLGAVGLGGDAFMLGGVRDDAFVLRKFDRGSADLQFDLKVISAPRVFRPTVPSRVSANRHRGFVRDKDGFLFAETGYYTEAQPPGRYSMLLRAKADGGIDRDFGRNGVVGVASSRPESTVPATTNVLIQQSGRIVMVATEDETTGRAVLSAHWPSLQR
jgi:hypothetical protein